jgi:hypothetical protein
MEPEDVSSYTSTFQMKKKSEIFKILGFVLLSVSCILFILIPVVPWLGFTAGQIAGISAGLLIAGEILFYLSLAILGKSFYNKIKSRLKFWKPKDQIIK